MPRRKTPVLLRRTPFSGQIVAITNYRPTKREGIIRVADGGQHDVTGDFWHLVAQLSDDEIAQARTTTKEAPGV